MAAVRIEVWALPYDGDAVQLPDLAGWEVSPGDTVDWGSVSIDYPFTGRHYDLLDVLAQDGVDLPIEVALTDEQGRQWTKPGLLLDIDTDDVDDEGVAKLTGVLHEYLFSEAVLPYAPGTENGDTTISGSAGYIMRLLMDAAQGRGCLPGVWWTFTDSHDSNGVAWERTANLSFSPGQHYAAVLGTLRGYQLSAWELTGDLELRLTNPDGKGVDRTVGPNPLTLEHGRDLGDAPRKFSLRGALTALMSSGKDGLYTEAVDPTAQGRRHRRIEGYHSFGNASDSGTLAALTQARLTTKTSGTTAVSHKLTLADGGPVPLLDYGVADWVFSATRRGVERRRVVQVTISGDGDDAVDAAVDLDAVIDDAVLQQAQRLDALESGGTVVGTSTPPADADDGSTPPQVSGLVVTSLWYSTGEGVGLASILAGWDPIPDSRIEGYHVEWRYLDEPIPPTSGAGEGKVEAAGLIRARILSGDPIAEDWTWVDAPAVVGQWNDVLLDEFIASGAAEATEWLDTYAPASSSSGWRREPRVAGTSTSWGSVTAGAGVRVRVAAENRWGRLGPWSSVVEATTETDGTPPPVASAMTLATRVGQVWGTWDGKGAAGEAMPGDFLRAEVHRSTTSEFEPDRPLVGKVLDEEASTTYRGELRAGMTVPDQMAPGDHGTTFYYRLVLVDRSHNAADPGEQASIVAVPVQDGEVAEIAAGKITAGIIDALVGIGQRLYAGTVNGPGWEGDPAGFRFYTGTGSARKAVLEFIANTGALTMLGRLISGAGVGVGPTVVVDPTSPPSVALYPDATTQRTRMLGRTTIRGDGTTAAGFEIETLNASGAKDGFNLESWSSNLWLGFKNSAGWTSSRLVIQRAGGLIGLYRNDSNDTRVNIDSNGRALMGGNAGYVLVDEGGDILLRSGGQIKMRGSFPPSDAYEGLGTFFVGFADAGGTTGIARGYGTTMQSSRSIFGQMFGENVPVYVSQSSLTSFTILRASGTGGIIYFLSIGHNG